MIVINNYDKLESRDDIGAPGCTPVVFFTLWLFTPWGCVHHALLCIQLATI